MAYWMYNCFAEAIIPAYDSICDRFYKCLHLGYDTNYMLHSHTISCNKIPLRTPPLPKHSLPSKLSFKPTYKTDIPIKPSYKQELLTSTFCGWNPARWLSSLFLNKKSHEHSWTFVVWAIYIWMGWYGVMHFLSIPGTVPGIKPSNLYRLHLSISPET